MWHRTLLRLVPALALSVALGACTAEVEDEGTLPEVNVEGGDLPAVDVNPAELEVTADTQQVVVPEVDVNAPGQ
jgi:hypothetical protein